MDRALVVFSARPANPRGAPHLVELAGARVVEGEVTSVFEELVCPPVAIEPEGTELHGIGEGEVRSAELAPAVIERFGEWVGEDWMAAHGAAANARVLAFECARHGLEPLRAPVLCSRRLAVRHVPETSDHELETLCQHLELEVSDRHGALAEAVYAWKVLEECLRRSSGLARTTLPEILAQCGAPVSVASSMPPPARLTPKLRRLSAALESGSGITLLYGGPAQEPSRLEVAPRFLFERHGKGYLEAECAASGLLKTYRLERVHKLLDG